MNFRTKDITWVSALSIISMVENVVWAEKASVPARLTHEYVYAHGTAYVIPNFVYTVDGSLSQPEPADGLHHQAL